MVAPDTVAFVKTPRTLAARLRGAREAAGLGVNELNRLVRLEDGSGLSDGYISSVETGRRKRIQARYATAIAATLKKPVDWLTDGRGPSGEGRTVERDKPNLDRVIEALGMKKRWGPACVAAARATEVDLPLDVWPDVLDRIERALQPVISDLDA